MKKKKNPPPQTKNPGYGWPYTTRAYTAFCRVEYGSACTAAVCIGCRGGGRFCVRYVPTLSAVAGRQWERGKMTYFP